jgi:DNA repair protein RecO (recombination protein O)
MSLIVGTRAIVINHLRYGDSSLVVNLYTESHGRQAVFVKGVFGKKSSKRLVLFQPLHLIEISLHYRPNRKIQQLSDVRICQPLHNIPFDPLKSSIALFIAEMLYKTLREEVQNPLLFDFLWSAVQTLDLSEKGTANFHLLFLVHFTRYLGFYPDKENLRENYRTVADRCDFPAAHFGSFLSPDFSSLLSGLFRLSFEYMDSIQMNRYQRNRLTEYLLGYYSVHIANFGTPKSLSVLQNLFRD